MAGLILTNGESFATATLHANAGTLQQGIRAVIIPGTHDVYDSRSIYRAFDLRRMAGLPAGSDVARKFCLKPINIPQNRDALMQSVETSLKLLGRDIDLRVSALPATNGPSPFHSASSSSSSCPALSNRTYCRPLLSHARAS